MIMYMLIHTPIVCTYLCLRMHMSIRDFDVYLLPFGSSLTCGIIIISAQRYKTSVLSFLYGSGAIVRSTIRNCEEANRID